MLSTRILTSIVLLAAFGSALILLGRIQFAVLVAFFVAVGAHEWGKLSHFRPRATLAYAGSMTVLFAGLLWMSDPIQIRQTVLQAVFAGSLIMWLVVLPVWLRAGVGRRPQSGQAGSNRSSHSAFIN